MNRKLVSYRYINLSANSDRNVCFSSSISLSMSKRVTSVHSRGSYSLVKTRWCNHVTLLGEACRSFRPALFLIDFKFRRENLKCRFFQVFWRRHVHSKSFSFLCNVFMLYLFLLLPVYLLLFVFFIVVTVSNNKFWTREWPTHFFLGRLGHGPGSPYIVSVWMSLRVGFGVGVGVRLSYVCSVYVQAVFCVCYVCVPCVS